MVTTPSPEAVPVRDILKSVPFFQDLTPEELDRVIAIGRVVSYSKDMVLFREGDLGEALYVVVDGTVRVGKGAPGVEYQAMAFMERGNCFGEMALVDDFPRSATVVAHKDCRVLFIEKEAILGLLQGDAVIARKILWSLCRTLSLRLREASDRIVSLSSFIRPF